MRRQAFDVLVIGPTERNLLFVTREEALARGSVLEVKEVLPTLAGSGANAAIGLARLGLKVGLVSAVGRDPLGDQVVSDLAGEGVETALVTRVSLAATGLVATIVREGGGPLLTVRSRGANELLEVTEEVQTMLHTTEWLYLTGLSGASETPTRMLLDALASEATRLFWAPGPEQSAGDRGMLGALLERTNVLLATSEEAQGLLGAGGEHEELERGVKSAGAQTVMLLEAEGSVHVVADHLHLTAVIPSAPGADVRGVRDALGVGFLAGSTRGGDPTVALQSGVTNAVSVASSLATQRGLLTKAVIEERLRTQPVPIEKSTV